MISYLSNLMIPLMIFGIILYGCSKKVNVYDLFVEGCKESFTMMLDLFPILLAMILAINILLKSGVLTIFSNILGNVMPFEIVPLAIMRPLSGTSTLAILNDILKTSGPDSFIGRLGSIIQGCTDTTFYVITLYFGTVGIKKIRYSLVVGLFADLIGIIASIIILNMI